MDYFSKTSSITLFDYLLIAVLASIISFILHPLLKYISMKIKKHFGKIMKNEAFKSIRRWYRIKRKKANFNDVREIEEKIKQGKVTKTEKQFYDETLKRMRANSIFTEEETSKILESIKKHKLF